jgi:aldehyde dehydrogenase (NAD+)
MNTSIEALRQYFQSGATQPFAFRLLQLNRLKQLVLDNEQALYKALYADLKKRMKMLGRQKWVFS